MAFPAAVIQCMYTTNYHDQNHRWQQRCGSNPDQGSGIWDPMPFWPMDPESRIGFLSGSRIPDLGSQIGTPNPYLEALWQLFWLKCIIFLFELSPVQKYNKYQFCDICGYKKCITTNLCSFIAVVGCGIRDPRSRIQEWGSRLNIPDPQHCMAWQVTSLRDNASFLVPPAVSPPPSPTTVFPESEQIGIYEGIWFLVLSTSVLWIIYPCSNIRAIYVLMRLLYTVQFRKTITKLLGWITVFYHNVASKIISLCLILINLSCNMMCTGLTKASIFPFPPLSVVFFALKCSTEGGVL